MWPRPLRRAAARTSPRPAASTTIGGGEQDRRVEVALQGSPGPTRAQPRPAAPGSRRRSPRQPACDIVGSSSPVPTPKWIRGTPWATQVLHRRQGRARLRQDRSPRSRPAGRAPAQESNSWTALAPASDLHPQERPGDLGQPAGEVVPERGIAVHQRLGPRWSRLGPPSIEVAGQGERRPGEADQRGGTERSVGPARIRTASSDVGRRRRRSASRSRSTSAAVRIGSATTGPTPGDDVEVDADGRQRHDDVGEEDRGVDAVTTDRLQVISTTSSGRAARRRACRCPPGPAGTPAANDLPAA